MSVSRMRPAGATLLFTALVLTWDASGFDLAVAARAGSEHGFAWREHWLLACVLHEGARWLAWLFALTLCLGVTWPWGPLRRLARARRLQLAITSLAAAFAVSALKGLSATSCPWDLQAFGGVARYTSHWQAGADGGPGHCFPAGHASSGFSFLGGYFAFRDTHAPTARVWLIAAAAAGTVLGLAQQLRGAHFTSHTLWTAWICWMVAWGIDRAWPAEPLESEP